MLTTNITILIVAIMVICCVLYIFTKMFAHKKSQTIITKFADYTSLLQYYMEKSYSMIYKDRILVFSLEATKVPEKQINAVSKDFILLVEKLLGPRLKEELIYFYGDYDTFAFVMAEYFSTRYEDDEIRKSHVDEMMESEEQLEGYQDQDIGGYNG